MDLQVHTSSPTRAIRAPLSQIMGLGYRERGLKAREVNALRFMGLFGCPNRRFELVSHNVASGWGVSLSAAISLKGFW